MNLTSRSTRRRRRAVAIVGALAVLTGGGALAISHAAADPCDPAVEYSCTYDPVMWEDTPAAETGEAEPADDVEAATADEEADPNQEPTVEEEAASGQESMVDEEASPESEATTGQQASAEIRLAIDEAGRMLTGNTDCETKVTGSSKWKASVILGTMDANGHFKDETNRAKVHPIHGRAVAAEAYKQGWGSDGTITFFAGWLLQMGERGISDEEMRTLTLLHELGHLTGSLSAKEADVAQWEEDVINFCIIPARRR